LFNLLSLLVQAELKLGKLEEAKMHLAELSDKANLLGEDIGYAFASEAEGILDMNQKNWEKAVGSFRNSLSAWNKLGRPYEKAKTLYELGISYQQKGDRKEASERFNEALEIFSRVGAKLDVENVLARKDLLGA